MKTQKEIKTKDGYIAPKGLPVTFQKDCPWVCLVRGPSREYRVGITSAFNPPGMRKLENWTNDGICKSVGGETVELDGWDSNGTPSWLLALGMI